ncbi:MAG: endolytic transglycosylase MltG, partial [Deltaproteobacteria bacterium]|nr:endolytic transglycosylase MltG [Deltaproteobacteria bacterium]
FALVADILEKEGVIAGVKKFRLFAKLKGVEKRIKAGDYTFHTAMTPSTVLNKLVRGEHRIHKVTIPEGFNTFQIAALLEKEGLLEKEKFLKYTSDPVFVHSLGINSDSLEGFLFPDTYQLRKGMGEERILRKLVARFNEIFEEQYQQRVEELNLSLEELITLASIVEKETSDPSERNLIAAVFYNRLKRGIMLQSDPTVIYGIQNFNGNLTKEDLKTKTPFNTYLIRGLPPHPIANPGEDSIKAVLYPSPKKYLYFVSKNDGTHHFSATLKEHNRAVNRYQKKRRDL